MIIAHYKQLSLVKIIRCYLFQKVLEQSNDEPEELDFMFDEELDNIEVGRKNTFTDWLVICSLVN